MLIPLILVFLVLLVNGWTDAPGSIATAVSTGAIKFKNACLLCALFNFLGVVIATLINTSVAEFVFSLGTLSSYTAVGICVVFFTMIIFGAASSFFGLPSSESHAMLSAMAGTFCAVAFDPSTLKTVGRVFAFMVFSSILALILGYASKLLFKWKLPYKKLQILSLSLTSFMHGWQGGLKFIGVIAFLLNIKISKGSIPLSLTLFVALVLALGSLMGGKKIIASMGNGIAQLDYASAFFSDIGTYFTLLICSLLGMPVSTGNVKCVAIMGTALGQKQPINKKTATKLIVSFIAVFPICFFISYLIMKLIIFLN